MNENIAIKEAFYSGYISCSIAGKLSEEASIAFFKIGINARAAYHEILSQFKKEDAEFSERQMMPNYLGLQSFCDWMAYKYQGCSIYVSKPLLDSKEEIKNVETRKPPRLPRGKPKKRSDQTRSGSKDHKNSSGRSVRSEGGSGEKHQLLRRRRLPKQTKLQDRSLLNEKHELERGPEVVSTVKTI